MWKLEGNRRVDVNRRSEERTVGGPPPLAGTSSAPCGPGAPEEARPGSRLQEERERERGPQDEVEDEDPVEREAVVRERRERAGPPRGRHIEEDVREDAGEGHGEARRERRRGALAAAPEEARDGGED